LPIATALRLIEAKKNRDDLYLSRVVNPAHSSRLGASAKSVREGLTTMTSAR
jgi:hypothetical protein